MSKEIKQETNKGKGKIYAIIAAIVAVLALFVIFKPNHNTQNTETVKSVATQEVETKDDKVMARIGIITDLADTDKSQFEVYVNGSETPEKNTEWLTQQGNYGYVFQNDTGSMDILIKIISDCDIKLNLRGRRDIQGKSLAKHQVEYTVLKINDVDIISEPETVWYGAPFSYTINAEKGEKYKVHVEWGNPDKE